MKRYSTKDKDLEDSTIPGGARAFVHTLELEESLLRSERSLRWFSMILAIMEVIVAVIASAYSFSPNGVRTLWTNPFTVGILVVVVAVSTVSMFIRERRTRAGNVRKTVTEAYFLALDSSLFAPKHHLK